MKTCNKCGETKEFSEFHKANKLPDGYQYNCKSCKKSMAEDWYYNKGGKQKNKISGQKYKASNRKKVNDKARKQYKKHRIKILERLKIKRQENPEWREELYEKTKSWREKNKEYFKEYMKKYHSKHYQDNKEKYYESSVQRKAVKLNAIPSYLKDCKVEKRRMLNTYKLSIAITKATGTQHHVDHMWPLADGGPHWSGNLQIITATENVRKHATVDPTIKATIQEMLIEEEKMRYAQH